MATLTASSNQQRKQNIKNKNKNDKVNLSLPPPMPITELKSIPGALRMKDKVHKIRLGFCCMDKKLKSDRAKNVISRIQAYGDIDIIPFGDHLILHRPIEEWPRCHVLCAFFSKGFPTEKVITYVDKYQPCLINKLRPQILLRDRLAVKNMLIANKIPTPRYAVLNRDDASHSIIEYDDKIIVNGITIRKPFVEKPMNAEDHNIYVYYRGGGSRRLFRKVGNRSSEPSSCSCIRREGSYIYEALIQSNKDIKVYTVGREYVHAETRKAPTVDGIVERDVFNKEKRQKCRLSTYEKKIATKIVDAFDQNVCGFDIIRSKDGRPFVIDVNGWSFVKNNRKYFDDCACRLRLMCLQFDKAKLTPWRYQKNYSSLSCISNSNAFVDNTNMHILRGIFGVFRHGDRTPKQKYKCSTHNENVTKLIKNRKKLKLKWTYLNNSQEILNFAKTAKQLYNETKKSKWLRISEIASLKFPSTKMQFKAGAIDDNGNPTIVSCILKWGGELTPAGAKQCSNFAPKFRDHLLKTDNKTQQKFFNKMKVFMTDEVRVRKTAKEFASALSPNHYTLIDGPKAQHMLDDIGSVKASINVAKQEIQHIFYNEELREKLLDESYQPPDEDIDEEEEEEEMKEDDDDNILFVESQVTNEVERDHIMMKEKIQKDIGYKQEENEEELDEKDLMEKQFEDELNEELNAPSSTRESNQKVKDEDKIILYPDAETQKKCELHHMSSPTYKLLPWAIKMLKQLQNPVQKCEELYEILLGLNRQLEENVAKSSLNKQPYLDESPQVMKQRWDKIIDELYDNERKQFDCSKIPDVFDSCRYDLLHNRHILRKLPLSRLWLLTELLAGFVMPQEYGLSKEMKLQIGRGVCKPLFLNIRQNIEQNCLENNDITSRCFLYFTSESYLHSLRNSLILSDIPRNKYVAEDIEGMECSYFSHGVIRIFEDPECNKNSQNRFYVDVSFSPGAHANPLIDVDKQVVKVETCGPLNGRFPLNKFLKFLSF